MRRLVLVGLSLAVFFLSIRALMAEDGDNKVVVFVAASTNSVVQEIGERFKEETGLEVEVVPGPSSGLVKQIVHGADADLFLSADQNNADYLGKEKLVAERRDLLTNRLVVVVPSDSRLVLRSLADLQKPAVERIALGEQKVPVGEYARQALRSANILDQVESKLVGAVDVKAVVRLVSRGEVDAGVVYATDTLGTSKVRVALEIEPAGHDPIVYPLVLVQRDTIKPAARTLYDFLASDVASGVFRRAGFGIVEEAAP